MIPLRDTSRSETYPLINNIIIGINVLVFLIQPPFGRGFHEFMYTYGLVPARYSVPEIAAYFTVGQQVLPFLTFMFLHGGLLHLVGNVWFLYIFGDNVEDHLGHFRYLFFYLLCGWASGCAHLALNWHAKIPTIGASGAIAGVMGAYWILYPKARVLTLVPIFFLPYFVEIPAFLFLGIWLLFQFLSAAGPAAQMGGIAWWAHIGGFIFGIVFLKLFQLVPELGADKRVRGLTRKRRSPRLHMVRPVSLGDDPDLHGVIVVSGREASSGARKLVNIMHGRDRRTFSVRIPPGVSGGSKLRLRGLGRHMPDGTRGDLYLQVEIRD